MTAPGKGTLAREGMAGQRCKEAHHWARLDNDPIWKGWPLPNVWLGVSAEDQRRADERIPDLLKTPAAVRFVSAEPLLGPIDFCNPPSVSGIGRYLDVLSTAGAKDSDLPNRIDWIIVGGESGPDARPFYTGWASDIVRQCKESGVPVFVKQIGAYAHEGLPESSTRYLVQDRKGGNMIEWPSDIQVREMPSPGASP
jgi:protein gp37